MPPTLTVLAASGSDVGMVRKLNEDSVLLIGFNAVEQSRSQPFALLTVADGMGGHDSGEVASSMAIRAIAAYIAENVLGRVIFNYGTNVKPQQAEGEIDVMAGGEPVGELLRQALEQANHQIVQQSRARKSDMGTTCVAAMIIGNNAWFANVGDSRGYLYRDGKLEQITEDHSLAWRLVQAGQLAREDIRTFDRRNEIYRSLGDDLRMEVDLFSLKLRPYDVLLLCSDGLWEMVNEEDIKGKPGIASIIEHSADPHDAVEKLLKAANEGGGEDNIGVVIAQLLVSDDEEGR
jgi:PPM family protein phosphatase